MFDMFVPSRALEKISGRKIRKSPGKCDPLLFLAKIMDSFNVSCTEII